MDPPRIETDADRTRARCHRLFGNTGKQELECVEPAAQQAVLVPALRNTGAGLWPGGQAIALNQGHPSAVGSQGRRRKATDLGADDDCASRTWFLRRHQFLVLWLRHRG